LNLTRGLGNEKNKKICEGRRMKRHPDYGLKDQASGCCPYCLASADMDCDCDKLKAEEDKRKDDIITEWKHFRSRIHFHKSFLDARAIQFVNEFEKMLEEI